VRFFSIVRSATVSIVYLQIQDPMPEVRQSSFALLGDLTKACFQHVQPHVGKFSVGVF